jgi:hypothetical protein
MDVQNILLYGAPEFVSRKTIFKKNFFGQKIKIFSHSENLKSAKTHLLAYFQPLWTKNTRNLAQELIENS